MSGESQQQQQMHANNWYFTRDELEAAGTNSYQLRYKMASFIQALGKQINVPHVSIATACVFAHRFYCRESFDVFEYKLVALVALFLAGKVEEHPKRLESILKGLAALDPKITGDSFKPEREEILDLEMVMLQVLCFDFVLDHPYRHVLKWVYAQKREQDLNQNEALKDSEDEFAQRAWSFVTTTFRTAICVQFPPKAVALACLRITAKELMLDVSFDQLVPELALTNVIQECQQELQRQLAMQNDFI